MKNESIVGPATKAAVHELVERLEVLGEQPVSVGLVVQFADKSVYLDAFVNEDFGYAATFDDKWQRFVAAVGGTDGSH